MPWLLLTIPIVSTLTGGLLAMRFRRYLVVLTALGAGLLLGAAFLDLLPEAIWLGLRSGLTISIVLGATLISFLCFYAVDSWIHTWAQQCRSGESIFRRTGAVMLIFHSFRDGMAIGAAYSASHAAGYAVACGIAAHDLGDGMNTVLLTTRGKAPTKVDYLFLAADAIAPMAGGLLTVWWTLSTRSSVFILVLAGAFFLQLATADLLPEVRKSEGARKFAVPAISAGALFIYVANFMLARLER